MKVHPFIRRRRKPQVTVLLVRAACLRSPVAAFYQRRHGVPSPRRAADAVLTAKITVVHAGSSGLYGSPRVHQVLRRDGAGCGKRRVARLMRAAGLEGRRKKRWRTTTIPDPAAERARDLIRRDFTPSPGADRRYVGDITYISTREGWAYLATVIDLSSRRVVGWALADHMRTSLVQDALSMAFVTRRPAAGLIFHSDRGCQGEFNRSSQHLQVEVGEWDGDRDGRLLGRARPAMRSPGRPPVARREAPAAVLGGDRQGNVRVRTPALRLVCLRRSVRDGSVTAAGSGRSAWRRRRGGTCRSRSGRRSRSCGSGGAGSARSPGVPAGRRRRSRGSCAGTLRPGAAGWSTGPWPLSGTQICGRRRPKTAKLAANQALREYVQDRLAGTITRPGGEAGAGPGCALDRPPARPPGGPALGQVVEPGADREPAAGRLP